MYIHTRKSSLLLPAIHAATNKTRVLCSNILSCVYTRAWFNLTKAQTILRYNNITVDEKDTNQHDNNLPYYYKFSNYSTHKHT